MKRFALGVIAVVASVLLTGCGIGPYQKEVTEEIGTNETAYLVALEGDTKANQQKFQSAEYLDTQKIASKRVTIPTRKRVLGRGPGNFEWIPTVRLIKVDRAPQTRAWTRGRANGTSAKDEAIHVESQDSVGFSVGVTCTGAIEEKDASTFLYHYAGRSLAEIMDSDVRNWVQSYASRQFGAKSLTECQLTKGDVFTSCGLEAKEYFKPFGLTIRNLGYSEGMAYENAEIQKKIDEAFSAELKKKVEEQARQAQTVTNQKDLEVEANKLKIQEIQNQKELAIAQNKRAVAEEFAKAKEAQTELVKLDVMKIQAEALATLASKWGGQVPSLFMGGLGGQASGQTQMPLVLPVDLSKMGALTSTLAPAPVSGPPAQ